MGLVQSAEDWVMSVCVKRGVNGAIIFLTSFAASHGIAKVLEAHGVTIDWVKFQVGMTSTIVAALSMLHDYLKVKKGLTWL